MLSLLHFLLLLCEFASLLSSFSKFTLKLSVLALGLLIHELHYRSFNVAKLFQESLPCFIISLTFQLFLELFLSREGILKVNLRLCLCFLNIIIKLLNLLFHVTIHVVRLNVVLVHLSLDRVHSNTIL